MHNAKLAVKISTRSSLKQKMEKEKHRQPNHWADCASFMGYQFLVLAISSHQGGKFPNPFQWKGWAAQRF